VQRMVDRLGDATDGVGQCRHAEQAARDIALTLAPESCRILNR
jgi:hypothetical protein